MRSKKDLENKKFMKPLKRNRFFDCLLSFSTRGQFHQCSTRSFWANSLAPVKNKPKM